MVKARPVIGARLSGLVQGVEALERPADGTLPVTRLRPGRFQPRVHFAEEALAELTQSVRGQGVLQPLLVRPLGGGDYEIVAGERRWRAAKAAGLIDVPVHIRELGDDEARLASALENLHRADLNPLEEAAAKLNIAAAALTLSPDEARARMFALIRDPERDPASVSRLDEVFGQLGAESWQSFVKNRIQLLQIPADVQEAVRGGLDYRKALVVARADAEARTQLLTLAASGATVQSLREALRPVAESPSPAMRQVAKQLSGAQTLRGLDARKRKRLDELLRQIMELLDS